MRYHGGSTAFQKAREENLRPRFSNAFWKKSHNKTLQHAIKIGGKNKNEGRMASGAGETEPRRGRKNIWTVLTANERERESQYLTFNQVAEFSDICKIWGRAVSLSSKDPSRCFSVLWSFMGLFFLEYASLVKIRSKLGLIIKAGSETALAFPRKPSGVYCSDTNPLLHVARFQKRTKIFSTML